MLMLMLSCSPASPLRAASLPIAMLLALASSSSSRIWTAAAFRAAPGLRPPAISRNPARGARRVATLTRSMSAREDDNYGSMKVSELRLLLKDRGLAVSGIKATLVERLERSEAAKVGGKNRGNERRKKKAFKSVNRAEEEKDRNGRVGRSLGAGGEYGNLDEDLKGLGKLEDDGEDDLAGIVDMLKAGDGKESNYEEKMAKRYNEERMDVRQNDLNKRPSNLVFAMEGDEEEEDQWDEYDDEDDKGFDPNQTAGVPRDTRHNKGSGAPQHQRQDSREDNVTFKDDFQGTRVFVQGFSPDATWQDLKEHFKIAGDVVYASVSVDKRGQSKQCGIVQFETPAMAKYAIREMRNHPMDGETLFVRKDVQEARSGSASRRRGGRDDERWGGRGEEYGNKDRSERQLPTEWKRANDPDEDGDGNDWYNLRPDELKEIEGLIEKRDKQRRMKNYKMSDQLRRELKDEFGVHLDDRLKLWWTDTRHGGVPGMVSEIKGEGRWGKQKPWRQIPTTQESDAMVDAEYVADLLQKRDRARRRKDFRTADDLLQRAHDAPGGNLGLRIHDESRTWRIWTERPPPRKGGMPNGYEKLSSGEMCLQMVSENEPEKLEEVKALLKKFPGREWNVSKKLKERYNIT